MNGGLISNTHPDFGVLHVCPGSDTDPCDMRFGTREVHRALGLRYDPQTHNRWLTILSLYTTLRSVDTERSRQYQRWIFSTVVPAAIRYSSTPKTLQNTLPL